MNDAPRCYGQFTKGEFPCAKCEFFDSCRYYTATAKSVNSRRHTVSFEAAKDIIGEIPAECAIPGEDEENSSSSLAVALGKFFRYLLELDDYTLSLIREIIAPSVRDKVPNIRQLGKIHGCSRQAIHRKMLSVIGIHPELSALFLLATTKLSAGRKAFLRKRNAAGI